jgi:hypothetical protein
MKCFQPEITKNIIKEETSMAKAKKGDVFSCEICGLVMVVDDACGCSATEIICCDEVMVKGRAAAAKSKQKAAALAAAKTVAKVAAKVKSKAAVKPAPKVKAAPPKPATKAAPVKKAAKASAAKPAATKPVAKKAPVKAKKK